MGGHLRPTPPDRAVLICLWVVRTPVLGEIVKSCLCYFKFAHLQVSEVSFTSGSRVCFSPSFSPLWRSRKRGCVQPELAAPPQKRWPCTLMTSSPLKKQQDLFIWQKQRIPGLSLETWPCRRRSAVGKKGQPTPPNASTGALGRV